jgi:hypothetical protein
MSPKNATVIHQPGLPYARDPRFNFVTNDISSVIVNFLKSLYVRYRTIPDQGDDKSRVSELLPVDTENDIARQ